MKVKLVSRNGSVFIARRWIGYNDRFVVIAETYDYGVEVYDPKEETDNQRCTEQIVYALEKKNVLNIFNAYQKVEDEFNTYRIVAKVIGETIKVRPITKKVD